MKNMDEYDKVMKNILKNITKWAVGLASSIFFVGAGPRDPGCRNVSMGVVRGTWLVQIYGRNLVLAPFASTCFGGDWRRVLPLSRHGLKWWSHQQCLCGSGGCSVAGYAAFVEPLCVIAPAFARRE